eukprot:972748-Amphidinium_carterae.1
MQSIAGIWISGGARGNERLHPHNTRRHAERSKCPIPIPVLHALSMGSKNWGSKQSFAFGCFLLHGKKRCCVSAPKSSQESARRQ